MKDEEMGINISGIIGDSYNILFKNRTVLVLCIIGALIGTVFNSLLMAILTTIFAPIYTIAPMGPLSTPPFSSYDLLPLALIAIVFILVTLFIQGVIISAVSLGSKAKIGDSIKKAFSRYISLIGASIASSFVSFLALLPGIALFVSMFFGIGASGATTGLVLLVLGIVLLIIPGMYVNLRISLSEIACVAGGKSAIESVKNSWSVTKGNLWSIFAIIVVLGIIEGVVGAFFSFIYTPVGVFVQVILAYPITIALVLIYQQIQPPAQTAKKPKK
jgi:hypothetical protein